MEGTRILIFLLGVGLCFGTEPPRRPPRNIARFFGLESNPQPQQPQTQPQQGVQQPQAQPQQVRKPVPLIYSVKYYDRSGQGEKVDVVPENTGVQGVPARVFLNLYSGQQTPVYYDNKGQLLVPCPIYDHLYVAGVDPNLVRRQPTPPKVVQTQPVISPQAAVPVPQVQVAGAPVQVPVPQVQVPIPEVVYYATPSFMNPSPVQKPGGGVGLTVVGVPYDMPYYSGVYPYGNSVYNPYGNVGYNPYVFVQPNPTAHQRQPQHNVGQKPMVHTHQPQPVGHKPVENKEPEKKD